MREIRGDTHQLDAAARSGLTQSKISRAERGLFTLSPDEADQYARAMAAAAGTRRELVDLCRAAQAGAVTGTARLVRRGTEIQRNLGDLERLSSVLRSWQPTVIPGLLQTWDYTVALMEWEPDARWAAQRHSRLALLDEEGRTFRQLLSEAALRWVVGSRKIMRGQLDHLVELSRRANIEIGVVPFGQTLVPPPEAGFHLYGDRGAVVATDAGTTFLNQRPDLDMFAETFDRLATAALYGDEARDLIERAARQR